MKRITSLIIACLIATVVSTVASAWEFRTTTDPMTDETRIYVMSDTVGTSHNHMDEPYRDARAVIKVLCKGAIIKTGPGHLVEGREVTVRFDRQKARVLPSAILPVNGRIHSIGLFPDMQWFLSSLASSNRLMVQLPWYQESPIFTWSLDGVERVLLTLQQNCPKPERWFFKDDTGSRNGPYDTIVDCWRDKGKKGSNYRWKCYMAKP